MSQRCLSVERADLNNLRFFALLQCGDAPVQHSHFKDAQSAPRIENLSRSRDPN